MKTKKILRLMSFLGAVFLIFSMFFVWKLRFSPASTQTVSPREGVIIEAIYGLGVVRAERSFRLKLGVPTTMTQLHVQEGDIVKKDQLLAEFQGTGSAHAPFSGTITNVYFQQSANIPAQAPILQLMNLEQKYVEVALEQEAALRVRPGLPVQVVFDTKTAKKYQGTLSHLFPKDNEFVAKVQIQGLDSSILPGMSADTVIEVGRTEKALLIPFKSVQSGQVLRMRNGETQRVDVQLGHLDGNWVEVLGGDLELTDLIVTR